LQKYRFLFFDFFLTFCQS